MEVIISCDGRNGRECGQAMNLSMKDGLYVCPHCGNTRLINRVEEITLLSSFRSGPGGEISPEVVLQERTARAVLQKTGENPNGGRAREPQIPFTIGIGHY